jgi:hypothetical protein
MTLGDQQVDQLGRGGGRLRAQQAYAQPDGRQAVVLSCRKAAIESLDHLANAPMPVCPVGGIDDDVGVAGAAHRHAPAGGIRGFGQLVRSEHKAAGPVEEPQEIGEIGKLHQLVARSRQSLARLFSQALDRFRL